MFNIDRRTAVKGIGSSALLLASGKFSMAQDTPRKGGILTVGVVQDTTKTLDPRIGVQLDERQVNFMIYNTLVSFNADFSLEPELAKSWTIEKEGLRYVLELQEGVKFHDGTDFNAEVVKWNIEQRLDESVGSPQGRLLRPVIDSIEILSPHTVAINLTKLYPALLVEFADRGGMMLSPAAAEKYGADLGRNPVGTGPFIFEKWVQGSVISVSRNPDYWQKDRVHLDGAEFLTVPNQLIGLQRIGIGEVDFISGLGPADLRQIDPQSDVVTVRSPIGRWYALQWQVNVPPFNNHTLRMAIAHAIDRDRINEILMEGQGTITDGIIPEGVWWHSPIKPSFTYSPEKAKELLVEAGWPMEETLTLTAPSDLYYSRMSQLVGEQLEAVGMKVELSPVPQSESYSRIVKRLTNFVPVTWGQRGDPDSLIHFLFHSEGGGNTTGYSDPETDRYLEQARQSLDQDFRREMYGKAQNRITEQLPYIPLFFGADYRAITSKLHGYTPSPDSFPRFRYCWKSA
jgi:peptide/nickel transport system substrate-binding protein